MNWRNKYYMQDLEQVIAQLADYSLRTHSAPCSPIFNQDCGVPNMYDPQGLKKVSTYYNTATDGRRSESTCQDLPPVAFGAPAHYNYPSSLNPTVWLSSLHDLKTVSASTCSVKSSDYLSDTSPSPIRAISEPSTPTATSYTKCPSCPKMFTGTSASQRRSLRRHVFSSHNMGNRLSCLDHTCSETFSNGRPDNRKRHMVQKHGWTF